MVHEIDQLPLPPLTEMEEIDHAEEPQPASDDVTAPLEPAPSLISPPPPPRRRTRTTAWPLSFTLALTFHVGLIALGLYAVHRSMGGYEPPQLILPKGWATEFEGSGSAGAAPAFQNLQTLTITAPKSETPELTARQAVGHPPDSFDPPDIPPPQMILNPASGTADLGPLPTLAANVLPPANFRTPPVTAADEGAGGATQTTATAAPPNQPSNSTNEPGQPSDSTDHATGRAQTGTGNSTVGGPQGVPEGLPVPSIRNKIPPYPAQALRNQWTGTVILELTISATGQVTQAKILKSSSYEILDNSALETAKTWQFTPARLNGQPIALTVTRPVNFEQPN